MKQLDPKSVWLFFISFVLRWFIVVFLISLWGLSFQAESQTDFSGSDFLRWLWIVFPLFLVLCFIWAKLTYRFYRYEMAESGFKKESGVIYKKYVTIPYERIQNVDIYRGILARILGLSDLHIQTAGMSAVGRYGAVTEGRLPGLSREEAETLRDELIRRVKHRGTQGL